MVSCLLLFEQAELCTALTAFLLLYSSYVDFSMLDCFADFLGAKKTIRHAEEQRLWATHHLKKKKKGVMTTDQDDVFNFSSRTFLF